MKSIIHQRNLPVHLLCILMCIVSSCQTMSLRGINTEQSEALPQHMYWLQEQNRNFVQIHISEQSLSLLLPDLSIIEQKLITSLIKEVLIMNPLSLVMNIANESDAVIVLKHSAALPLRLFVESPYVSEFFRANVLSQNLAPGLSLISVSAISNATVQEITALLSETVRGELTDLADSAVSRVPVPEIHETENLYNEHCMPNCIAFAGFNEVYLRSILPQSPDPSVVDNEAFVSIAIASEPTVDHDSVIMSEHYLSANFSVEGEQRVRSISSIIRLLLRVLLELNFPGYDPSDYIQAIRVERGEVGLRLIDYPINAQTVRQTGQEFF